MIDALLDLHFLRPLWLLALPLLALAAWRLRAACARARWQHLIAPHLLPHLLLRGNAGGAGRHALPLLLALACVAAAGPAWDREAPPFAEHQAPLLIALDLSAAMDAGDLAPSRLERAKLKLHDLLQRRPGARHALLVYAGSAHLLLPPSDDAKLFGLYLDSLQSELTPRPGKDTLAVLEAMDRLQADSAEPYLRLLVTAEVEPNARARLAADDSLIWAATADSTALHDELDNPVIDMRSDDADLDRLVRALDASQRLARHGDPDSRWHDRGWWLLWPLALLLLLRLRRAAPALLLLPLLASPPQAHADGAEGVEAWRLWRTPAQQAMQLFQQGNYAQAARLFTDPQWRGAALYRAGDYAAALAEFEHASDARARYNQGNALARLERYAEAAERYQLALAEAPQWQTAQDNLALVLQLEQQRAEEPPGEPNQSPDEIRFDLQKNRGSAASQQQSREEQARLWLNGLETGPAGYLKRRMAVQLHRLDNP